jgi:hypothetical protein
MNWLKNFPEWLGAAVIGAVFAVAGYLAKSGVDWWQSKRAEHAATIAHLQNLQALLRTSRAVFDIQAEKRNELMNLLKQSHPKESGSDAGYEEIFSRCFSTMNEQEKELQGIIRAYSEHSMRSVNQALSDWLKADTRFKTGNVPSVRSRELAAELFALEMHLLLWHAKYESWIPKSPEHALIYMNDEQKHGVGFPKERKIEENGVKAERAGVDAEVSQVLEELRRRWQ